MRHARIRNVTWSLPYDIYAYPMLLEHKFGQFIAMDKDKEAVSK
jgi:hypothetical protein